MEKVALTEIIQAMQLENMTPEIPLEEAYIESVEVSRPGLQLTGYFDYFDNKRIQVMGKIEYSFVQSLPGNQKVEAFEELFKHHIPAIVLCKGLRPSQEVLALAREYGVPFLCTQQRTSRVVAKIMRILEIHMAPMIAIHGVLVDVYGEGVLILGESGLGKSEAALELIKRGHQLVADDSVEIRRYSENELVGSAPKITRNLMELRGIGIIDVRTLYGVQSVKDEMLISMVVKLKYMDRDQRYERLGMKEEFVEYLGNALPCFTVPVSPGRNIAVIVETAAVNYRAKRTGFDAMEELQQRLEERLQNSRE